jgi:hypothetical protein
MKTNMQQQETTIPFEYISTQIPRKSWVFLGIALAGTIGTISIALVNILLLGNNDLTTILYQTVQTTIAIAFLIQATLIYHNTIKKGENIIIKKHRGAMISFAKAKQTDKILFEKKDPTTEVTVLWNGTATEKNSGTRVIQITEGMATNENINLSVAESDWQKNLKSMVRAKTYADLAEQELLNNTGLLGMKWQDITLIIIALITIIILLAMFFALPSMISEATIEQLLKGTLQTAVQSIIKPTP